MGAGKDFLLKVELVDQSGTFTTVGGLQSKGGTINAEAIDITNHGSNQWREIIDAAGKKSVDVSGSGYYDNGATLQGIKTKMLAQTLTRFQLIDAGSGGQTLQGYFKVTSLEQSADHDGAQEYSISLQSSGEIALS